jgi:hypothetical protein
VFLSIGRLLLSVLKQKKSLAVCLSNCNQILHSSESSLEVQGGLDYFRIVEGTSIIALCLSSSLSLFYSAAFRFCLSLQKLYHLASDQCVQFLGETKNFSKHNSTPLLVLFSLSIGI